MLVMGMLFMLRGGIVPKEDYPLLSCADIKSLLAHFLLRLKFNVEEVIPQLEFRHQKRQTSPDFGYAKQQLE